MNEKEFKKKCSEDNKRIMDAFTEDEHAMITLVPIIVTHIAWKYAFLAKTYCRDMRIAETKKPCRELEWLRTNYINTLKKDLSQSQVYMLFDFADKFFSETQKDFTIMYFAVNGEIKKFFPDSTYDEMRTYAYISLLLLRFIHKHNNEMNDLIEKRLGSSYCVKGNPLIELEKLICSFCGEIRLDDSKHIHICEAILNKNIKRIKFFFK